MKCAEVHHSRIRSDPFIFYVQTATRRPSETKFGYAIASVLFYFTIFFLFLARIVKLLYRRSPAASSSLSLQSPGDGRSFLSKNEYHQVNINHQKSENLHRLLTIFSFVPAAFYVMISEESTKKNRRYGVFTP